MHGAEGDIAPNSSTLAKKTSIGHSQFRPPESYPVGITKHCVNLCAPGISLATARHTRILSMMLLEFAVRLFCLTLSPFMTLNRLILIPLSLGLFACASHEPKAPKTTDSFSTLILADNTKQFSYTLVMELPERAGGKRPRGGRGMGGSGGHPDGPPPGGGRGKGPDKSGDETVHDGLKHLTEEGLLAKLEDTSYYTNGYRQLETQSRRGAMNIVGECYDKATETDRANFPNPEPKKVVEERLD